MGSDTLASMNGKKATLLWWLCEALDALPMVTRDRSGKWRIYRSTLGCRLGIFERAIQAEK